MANNFQHRVNSLRCIDCLSSNTKLAWIRDQHSNRARNSYSQLQPWVWNHKNRLRLSLNNPYLNVSIFLFLQANPSGGLLPTLLGYHGYREFLKILNISDCYHIHRLPWSNFTSKRFFFRNWDPKSLKKQNSLKSDSRTNKSFIDDQGC